MKKIFLIITGTLSFLCIFLPLWAFVIEPNRVSVNEVEIKLPAWPDAFKQLKIVAISDIHAGSPYINEAKLEKIVSEINQMQPDLIVILGDFIAHDKEDRLLMEPEVTADKLKPLRAKYGVFAVLGNHDWWFNGERVRRAFRHPASACWKMKSRRFKKTGRLCGCLAFPTTGPDSRLTSDSCSRKSTRPAPSSRSHITRMCFRRCLRMSS